MPAPVSVILADDHYIFRTGFKSLVAAEEDIQLLSIATDGTTLLQQVSRHVPDVVVMAMHLPGSVEACCEIRRLYPQTTIVALGPAPDETIITEMMNAGAAAIINKTATMHQMAQCIKRLHCGDDAGDEVVAAFTNNPGLNNTEIAVLEMLCRQMDSEEIGKQLYLSKHTIDHIRKTLLQKCGVKNTVGLVMFAVKSGIVKV